MRGLALLLLAAAPELSPAEQAEAARAALLPWYLGLGSLCTAAGLSSGVWRHRRRADRARAQAAPAPAPAEPPPGTTLQ